MNRRKFLQNMFGAALLAAMPKIVVDQIISLQKPVPISSAVNGVAPIFTKKVIIPPNGLLYIWDDIKNALIGASNNFNLNIHQDWIEVPKSWENPIFNPMEYLAGLKSWDISADNIQWVSNPKEFIEESRKLRCLIAKDNIKINGEIYISQLSLSASDVISSSAEFTGSGELIVEAL